MKLIVVIRLSDRESSVNFSLTWIGPFIAGVVATSTVLFHAASILLVPYGDMIRWITSTESQERRIEKALSPDNYPELRAKLEATSDALKQCNAGAVKSQATSIHDGPVVPVCTTDLTGAAAVKIHEGTTKSFLGGRLHVSVRRAWDGACTFLLTTEKNLHKDGTNLVPGSMVLTSTSAGDYRLVLTGVSGFIPFFGHCTFDLISTSKGVETGSIGQREQRNNRP